MTDRSEWIRVFLDDLQRPSDVALAANAVAASRGLPMVVPLPGTPTTVRKNRVRNSVLMHPEVYEEWNGNGATVRPQRRVSPGRRMATGKARLAKGGA